SNDLGRIKVADGNFFQATFDDPAGFDGFSTVARSELAVWRAPVNGVISADDTQYFYSRRFASSDPIHDKDCSGRPAPIPTLPCRPDTAARVWVEDQDQNDPRVRDEIRVTAVPISPNTAGASIALKEVGINSGLFEGLLFFTEDANDVDPSRLDVSDIFTLAGDGRRQFRFEYSDPSGGTTGTQTSVASNVLLYRHIKDPNVRVVRLEALETFDLDGLPTVADDSLQNGFARYRVRNNIPIPARPANGNPGGTNGGEKNIIAAIYTAPGIPTQSTVIEVSSTRCPEPNVIPLSDTNTGGPGWAQSVMDSSSANARGTQVGGIAGDGRYARVIGIFPFNERNPNAPIPGVTGAGDNCSGTSTGETSILPEHGIGIQPTRPDTVTVRVTGSEFTLTARATQSDTTRVLTPDGRVLGPLSNFTGDLLANRVEVTSVVSNFDRAVRDFTVLSTRTVTNPIARPIVLFETGADTNVFAGSFLHQERPDFGYAESPNVFVTLTNAGVLPDARIPGVGGDRCDGAVLATYPTFTATGRIAGPTVPISGVACVQLTRTLPNGASETLALAASSGVEVLLSSGLDLGPAIPATIARCSKTGTTTTFDVVGGEVPASPSPGLFSCGQLKVGSNRYVLGDP
ncbi:MAG TPA: hypothetical protein VGB18_07320, partial [Candidatus Thermoplasmatota archaeon]